MKQPLLFIVLLLANLLFLSDTLAQKKDCERMFEGQLFDETDGWPLPGVNFVIKGTTRGTVSNIEGVYQLKVCIGDVIEISYVGYAPQSVTITASNTSPIYPERGKKKSKLNLSNALDKELSQAFSPYKDHNKKPSIQDFVKDTTFKGNVVTKGAAYFSESSPTFIIGKYRNYYITPRAFKKGLHQIKSPRGKKQEYVLTQPYFRYRLLQFGVELTSQFDIDQVGKLPEVQQTFAQGRSNNGALTWFGAEDNEIFSWGPSLSDLTYDGVATPYQLQGNLVTNGTGQVAQAFDGLSAFQNAFTQKQQVKVITQLGNNYFADNITLRYQNSKRYNQLFPSIDLSTHELELKSSYKAARIKMSSAAHYVKSTSFLGRGGALTNLVGSTLLTPSSFDNAAGLSKKDAVKTTSTYNLSDGSPRSFAPNSFDNPFALLANNPNQNESQNYHLSHHMSRSWYQHKLNLQLSWSQKLLENRFGIQPNSGTFSLGRLTEREERFNTFQSNVNYKYQFDIGRDITTYLNGIVNVRHDTRSLNRNDGNDFSPFSDLKIENASNRTTTIIDQDRTIGELIAKAQFRYDNFLYLDLSNQSYTSSTLTETHFFMPSASISFELMNALNVSYREFPISLLKFFAGYGSRVKETNLAYGNFHYNSTRQSLQEAFNFYGDQELALPNDLKAQEIDELELGFVSEWDYLVKFKAVFFQKNTHEAIYPVWENGTFELQNVGQIQNRGFDAELKVDFDVFKKKKNQLNLAFSAVFSRYRPVVKKLNTTTDILPVAGFTEVSTNLVEGEPVGVLIGSTFERNALGQTVIDADGFPVMSSNQQIIGNPNPNFTGAFTQEIKWNGFQLMATWTFRNGGDIWNGTQQQLDYYGRSANTAALRNTQGFVFDGVLANGNPNTQAVAFYDPAQGVEQNRWTRYGIAGVAEEYIQKGSWFRLSEISLAYHPTYKILDKTFLENASIKIYARNLFLSTPYTGVDPQSTLFGYQEGNGLDLFNAPTTRQYGVRLQIQI